MNSSNPITSPQLGAAQRAARTLGVQVFGRPGPERTRRGATRSHQAPWRWFPSTSDILFYANAAKIAQVVRKARLAAMFPSREYHDAGVLMSYGTNTKEVGRMLAGYVDKMLKGTKPADLPIEQISKYELVIDLRVAREQRIKAPQELLFRADEVVQ